MGALLGSFVIQLPVLAVLVTGLVLLGGRGRQLPGRGAALARAGLLVILAEAALGMLWSALLPFYLSRLSVGGGSVVRTVGLVNASAQFLLGALLAVGLGLLVAALRSGRQPAPPGLAAAPFPPGAAPSHPPGAAPSFPPGAPRPIHPAPRRPSRRAPRRPIRPGRCRPPIADRASRPLPRRSATGAGWRSASRRHRSA
jgi:hypothetical protein